jgi:hypothetical protein
MPALLLTKERHTTGQGAFHNLLRQKVPHQPKNTPGGQYSNYTGRAIADFLEETYDVIGEPNAWRVAEQWLFDLGKL